MTAHYRLPPESLSAPSAAVKPTISEAPSSRNASARFGIYRHGGKRILDALVIVLSLPAVLPVILVLALLVMRDGSSPFYCQTRVGRGGRLYRMWKLRTMVADADARLEACLAACPEARREWDRTQKLKADPRITSFGRFLRKSSLDELPQLLNVLRGDMSLVGPRPMMPDQTSLYPGKAYYMLRPGITGLWQVSERNASAFAERAHYDTLYEQRLTLMADLRILAATTRVVLRGTGY